jgi:hypothetical protein
MYLMETAFVAYIGIDWADRKHDICLQDAVSDPDPKKWTQS